MSSLWTVARDCLLAREPEQKLELTHIAVEDWCNGYLSIDPDIGAATPSPDDCIAGLPKNLRLVPPRQLPLRKLGSAQGHAALIHAIAHIEFNAINLAWDAVYRFRGLPRRYYRDWVQVANEEAYHFSMMSNHLETLGYQYGDLPAHNGLWRMACDTADDPLRRMALVPRVLEARGLDVTPGIIERVRQAGDQRAVRILEIILADEIGHVAIGSRWFEYLCELRARDPASTYLALYRDHFGDRPGGPINRDARLQAGFKDVELAFLQGEDVDRLRA